MEVTEILSCLRYCKSTIFQANHNGQEVRTHRFDVVCDTAKVRFFKQITTFEKQVRNSLKLFAILQKYDFSSKSQRGVYEFFFVPVVCDTAKVRFFKQITTRQALILFIMRCLRYCKSTIFQANHNECTTYPRLYQVVCDTAKVRFFKQITTSLQVSSGGRRLFAILQKYDFSSKSQPLPFATSCSKRCLRYCKSTIFQANHNVLQEIAVTELLFAILQKYDFSSKSQRQLSDDDSNYCCLRYCKSTIFQANHNSYRLEVQFQHVVCDTAKVRFFKQITTRIIDRMMTISCLRYCKSTIFQANHNCFASCVVFGFVVCDTAKVRFFKQITTRIIDRMMTISCLRYCKSTIFQANHNRGL